MTLRKMGSTRVAAFWIVLSAAAFGMALPSAVFAQDIPAEIQSVANLLAREGYDHFRLQNAMQSRMILYAEQDGEAIDLTFDPKTLRIVAIRSGIDENLDGRVSQTERHRINMQEQPYDATRLVLQVAQQTHLRVEDRLRLETDEPVQTRTQLATHENQTSGTGPGPSGGGNGNGSGGGNGGGGRGS